MSEYELLRKCIHLLVSNRSMNSILNILLDYVVIQTGNTNGFIGERKIRNNNQVYYRYHAVYNIGSGFSKYIDEYKTHGFFDLEDKDHTMHEDISIGDIHIKNVTANLPAAHPPVEKSIFLPLHDTSKSVIGILGLSGKHDFTAEKAASYAGYIDMCSYILQLAIERNSMNFQKNRFLTNVSNALREPIDGMLSMKKQTLTTLTPAQKQYIDVVTFYSMKLLDMVNDIQDYTRMVSGNLVLVNRTMDLHACLDAVKLISEQNAHPRVSVNVVKNDLPAIVVADEVRITQILVNLMDNACKFTTRGSINMEISARPGTNDHTHELLFEISDTGAGMTPEQVYNIFGGTYIALSKTNANEKHVGIGLGLLIVKYLIEMFGGSISLTSNLQVGTTVKFNLFVGKKHELSKEQIKHNYKGTFALLHGNIGCKLSEQLAKYGIKSIQSANLKEAQAFLVHKSFRFSMIFCGDAPMVDKEVLSRHCSMANINFISLTSTVSVSDDDNKYILLLCKDFEIKVKELLTAMITDAKHESKHAAAKDHGRILIAEDNEDNMKHLISLLNLIGFYDIDTVNDGLELYVKLTANTVKYSMVFVSVTLSVLDGITAIKRFKQTTVSPVRQMIIIGMSDKSEMETDCLDAGMDDFLVKPITLPELRRGTACPT